MEFSFALALAYQHGPRDVTCKPAVREVGTVCSLVSLGPKELPTMER